MTWGLVHLLQHRINGDVGACASNTGAAVNNDGPPVGRVSLQGLPNVRQYGEGMTGYPVIGPAGVVKLVDFALSFRLKKFKFKNKNINERDGLPFDVKTNI